jgi:hypothetical protein
MSHRDYIVMTKGLTGKHFNCERQMVEAFILEKISGFAARVVCQ